MPTGIINLDAEGRLSPTLFHPTNPERFVRTLMLSNVYAT